MVAMMTIERILAFVNTNVALMHSIKAWFNPSYFNLESNFALRNSNGCHGGQFQKKKQLNLHDASKQVSVCSVVWFGR